MRLEQHLIASVFMALPTLASATQLRCVGTNFPAILEEHGADFTGVAVDVLAQLQTSQNIACKIEMLPWKRALELVEHRQADMLIGAYRTQARVATMLFVGQPFFLDVTRLYAQVGNNWDGDWDTLHGSTVGLPSGWTLGQNFEVNRWRIKLTPAISLEHSLQMLVRGRVQYVAADERDARFAINKLGVASLVHATGPVLQQTGGYFVLNADYQDSALAEQLARGLAQLHNSGRLKSINEQHGLAYPGKEFDWAAYQREELRNR